MNQAKHKSDVAQFSDDDLEGIHGGAWSLGALDPNIRGFNPQPEPPAEPAGFDAAADLKARGFNPQPEPPARSKLLHK